MISYLPGLLQAGPLHASAAPDIIIAAMLLSSLVARGRAPSTSPPHQTTSLQAAWSPCSADVLAFCVAIRTNTRKRGCHAVPWGQIHKNLPGMQYHAVLMKKSSLLNFFLKNCMVLHTGYVFVYLSAWNCIPGKFSCTSCMPLAYPLHFQPLLHVCGSTAGPAVP